MTPDWLNTTAPKDAPPVRVITPSDSGEDDVVPAGEHSGLGREKARARGIIVHRLLQSLPEIPAAQRAQAAQRYLARAVTGMELSEAETVVIAERVLHILADPRFSPLFAPGSRAEVPIIGRIEHKGETVGVSGQMDRLAVTAGEILIADYKTGNPAPKSPEESPKAYLRQLALYRALLMKIYPGRAVRAALVWTDMPDLMEIPPALLDAQIATLTSA
jgi:ATP-dependent helicase/nuclease subunit A